MARLQLSTPPQPLDTRRRICAGYWGKKTVPTAPGSVWILGKMCSAQQLISSLVHPRAVGSPSGIPDHLRASSPISIREQHTADSSKPPWKAKRGAGFTPLAILMTGYRSPGAVAESEPTHALLSPLPAVTLWEGLQQHIWTHRHRRETGKAACKCSDEHPSMQQPVCW